MAIILKCNTLSQENEWGLREQGVKQKWMTEGILALLEKRRKCKNKDNIKYKEIKKTQKRKTEGWMEKTVKSSKNYNKNIIILPSTKNKENN